MRPFGVWFGRLAMAGACLGVVGCGGGDVPDPDSDRLAAQDSSGSAVARGPAPTPPADGPAAPEKPADPTPKAEADGPKTPVEPKANDAPVEAKPEPAKPDAPGDADKPASPAPDPKTDPSGTDELLRMAGTPPAAGGASPNPSAPGSPSTPSPQPGAAAPGGSPPAPATPGSVAPGRDDPGRGNPAPSAPGGPGKNNNDEARPIPGAGAGAGALPTPSGGGGGALPMPGVGGGGGGGGGDSSAAGNKAFNHPVTAVTAFLAALKSKDRDRIESTTADRAPTEAAEKHQKIFSEIKDKSISDDELDEMAKAMDGFQVISQLTAKSTGRIGVLVGKKSGKDVLQRTIMTRKEAVGWRVMDISDMYDFKPGLPPIFNGRGRGRRR